MLQFCWRLRFQQWKHCPVASTDSTARLVGLNWQLKITTWLFWSTLHIYHIYQRPPWSCRKSDKDWQVAILWALFDLAGLWTRIVVGRNWAQTPRSQFLPWICYKAISVANLYSKCCRDTTAFFTFFDLPWQSAQTYWPRLHKWCEVGT